MNYNEAQLLAIRHFRGPALILAGPGSGKTAVITQRTRQLITEYGVSPSNILVITFTKAAAREMEQRFSALMDEKTRVTFGTFHAVFFMVLKLAYHMNVDNIITEKQKNQLMRELIARHEIDYRDEKDLISGLLSEISVVKNSDLKLEEFSSTQCEDEVFRKVFCEYDRHLRAAKLIDFDDMLTYTYELFDQRPDILSAWQKKYHYILIDEFQDINPLQYKIIRMMALPENNLFIVGDDDQSIYRFRGSKPEIMLGFCEDYPGARQILLDTNYRCDGHVVQDSLRLIGHNRMRFQKEIRADRPMKNPVHYQLFEDQKMENAYLADTIEQRHSDGAAWENFAVLFRTNTQPRRLIELLMERNIPFRVRDHIPNIYEHWIATDIFTYIRIAKGSRQRKDFLRIMNRPVRYISRDSLSGDTISFEEWAQYYSQQDWIADRIERMAYDARIMENMSPFAMVNYIRHAIDYDSYLKDYAERRSLNEEEFFETAEELQQSAKGFRTFEEWEEHIRKYSDELVRLARARSARTNAVTLATLHSSKGLEFGHVFIIDANDDIYPYKKAVLEEDIEEERRMFYVGMTRAKEQLEILSTKLFNGKEQVVSEFVMEARGMGNPGIIQG